MQLVDRRRPSEHGAVEPATIARDLDAMLAAIADVRAHEATTPVLLQPHVAGTWRGVLFADTVAQRRGSTSLTVARRADHTLDWVAQLDQHGRVRDVMSATAGGGPPTVVLHRLSRLADGVAARFDAPHDLEWVADDDGRLQLLRIDPVVHLRAATGPARPLTIAPRRARRRRTATVAPAFVDSRSIGDSAA